MEMPSLSVIIITKNEAADIRDCLESVKWADEIVVLDSGSTDGTPTICREYTNKIYDTDWPGYGPQKNRALQKATSDWVFSIDADERASEQLRAEIKTVINSPQFDAYTIPRQNFYCGKLIKYGAWNPDHCLRLFRRNQGKFDDAIVHENVIVAGKIGKIQAPLMHYTYKTLEEALYKLNEYSSHGAKRRLQEGKTGGMFKAILHSLWAFVHSYWLRLGFLDGKEGFMIAVSNAEYCYYRYLKLMHLTQSPAAETQKD